MAKKWIVIMLVACIGLGGGLVYIRQESDSQAPEIKCTDQAENEYDPSMSDADLLKGMMATDDKDGDVTSSLTVESVYEVDDSNVVVTYVAKDSANNIAKFKRDMQVNPDEMKKNIRKKYNIPENKKVILCALDRRQAVILQRFIRQTDDSAFIMITKSSETFGKGFRLTA